jgi:hypothetical protein
MSGLLPWSFNTILAQRGGGCLLDLSHRAASHRGVGEGPLTTLCGHSASHFERLFLPHSRPLTAPQRKSPAGGPAVLSGLAASITHQLPASLSVVSSCLG